MKNVLITGATGMVGSLVLQQCLNSDKVSKVYSFTRRNSSVKNPKLEEIILPNFKDFSSSKEAFKNVHIAFFCLGV